MFLTSANLVYYLNARGIVKASEIVDGQFCVIEAGQHNRNFKILLGDHKGVFVKQIQNVDNTSQISLLRESQCYLWAQNFPAWAALIPDLIGYDQDRHILILELINKSQNLREYFNQKNFLSEDLAGLLGQSLSTFHGISTDLNALDLAIPQLEKKVPWIFTYHKKSFFPENSLSNGAIHFAEILRGLPKLISHLDRLFDLWHPNNLIHGDLKWDNILVSNGSDIPKLSLIDWELVDFGDTRWDVGSVFQSYLSHWIMRNYRDKEESQEKLLMLTNSNMPSMFNSIRIFWISYCEGLRIPVLTRPVYLLQCLEFGAVRMLRTTFESLYGSKEVSQHAYALIELSQQILDDPRKAAINLFGFEDSFI